MTAEVPYRFPDRPIQVLSTGAAGSWIAYLIGLAMLAGGIAFAVWQAPSLISDNQIRQDLVVVEDGSFRNGKCRTRKAIFTECEGQISYVVDGRRYDHRPDIFFIDFNTGGYTTGVVRSASRPELGTMSIAIDYFWDRVFTVVGIAGILSAIGIGSIFAGFQNGRMKRDALSAPVHLELGLAEITQSSKSWRGTTYNFKAVTEGKVRQYSTTFAKGDEPLVTSDGYVLAAVPEGSRAAVLLDRDLKRFDLNEGERSAFIKASTSSEPIPAAASA